MKPINSYITEKLHVDDSSKIELSKEAVDELNNKKLKDALIDIKEFVTDNIGKEGEDYELKVTNSNEIRIYIYGGDKEDFKEIESKFYKEGYGKKDWLSETAITMYGLRIRLNFIIHKSDFEKKVFNRRRR